jgi:nicotinamidase-related amidase
VTVANTDPYPWPYDAEGDVGVLGEGDRLALVVTGAQQCFADRVCDARDALARIDQVAGVVRGVGGFVVFVRHHGIGIAAVAGPRTVLPVAGAPEHRLVARHEDADEVVDAGGVDGFYGSDLELRLRMRGRDRLLFAGLGAETTVDSTLRSANDRGFECLTLTDASAPHDPALAARAHASVTMSGGIFGAIGTSTDLCAALSALVSGGTR